MKLKTVLVATVAGGLGYVLGTKAGRERYEVLKAKASDLAHSPHAQDAAAKIADVVKENAAKLPDPVADVVTSAADAVAGAPKTGTGASADPASGTTATPGATSS